MRGACLRAVASEQSAAGSTRAVTPGSGIRRARTARRDFAATCTVHVLRGRKRAECASRAEAAVPGSDKRRACTATRDFAKRATCAAGSMPHPLAHPLTALCPGGPAPAICADACRQRVSLCDMLFEAMLSRSFEPRSSSRSSLAGTNTLQMCGYSRTRTARREFADGAACAAGVSAQFSRLPLRFMFRSSDAMLTRWDVQAGTSPSIALHKLSSRSPYSLPMQQAQIQHKFRRVQRYPCVSTAGLHVVVVDARLGAAPLRRAQCARTACTARVVGAPSGVWVWGANAPRSTPPPQHGSYLVARVHHVFCQHALRPCVWAAKMPEDVAFSHVHALQIVSIEERAAGLSSLKCDSR
ncbi:hypothetical protein B0H11DRAFT_2404702 [Mycena galericulata]|nr:hypothetical protein B0H11DRAFT_2404702 [Mycena galericulata]